MISPSEIKTIAERKYISFLQSLIEGIPFTRLEIRGDKTYTKKSLPEFEKEITLIISQSKEKKGFGYSIDFQKVKTKYLGIQDLPISLYFDTGKDLLKYLGKEKEAENFYSDSQKITTIFPALKDWIIQNPVRIIQNQKELDNILLVCSYFKTNPKPNLYLRELPVNVHTKFIEKNQGIIKDLLNILISDYLNHEESKFEKRFNLKFSEPQIRFKILDKEISTSFSGLNDLAIPLSNFEKLNLPLDRVIVIENKTTLYTTLTLPKMKNTIAIFGGGYGVYNLKNVDWFTDIELLYWGDIDVQGFEILSQFRGYFPLTKSVLMDIVTFEKFFENDFGTLTNVNIRLNLTADEQKLYDILKTNNWRLEQEKIPFDYVNQYFDNEISPDS
jgi:hypothetical protein